MRRLTVTELQGPRELAKSRAKPSRTCGTVNAGVYFFPPQRFSRDEPGGDQR